MAEEYNSDEQCFDWIQCGMQGIPLTSGTSRFTKITKTEIWKCHLNIFFNESYGLSLLKTCKGITKNICFSLR